MKSSLLNIFIKVAYSGLKQQDRQGWLPPGHNGPYDDSETPVRNTSHWLITFSKAFQITGDKTFYNAVKKAGQYLLSKEARPYDKTFYHRIGNNKDKCNGLIGQAWSIEALIEAGETLQDDTFIKVATDVFNFHPFDFNKKLWKRVETDGRVLGYDLTFNHQLWFCSIGAQLGKYNNINSESILRFMDGVENLFSIAKSGRIIHSILIGDKLYKKYLKKILKRKQYLYMIDKEIGYHAFNLYAFAMLYQVIPKHRFWQSVKFRKILKYATDGKYLERLNQSKYSFPYNPPGFELPFIYAVFSEFYGGHLGNGVTIIQRQLDHSLNMDNWSLSKNTPDSITATARIYECVRFPHWLFNYSFKV